ncbi:MAG: porin family protein [Neisseria sp.]|nr:porin family protein [Neisseria sp.]
MNIRSLHYLRSVFALSLAAALPVAAAPVTSAYGVGGVQSEPPAAEAPLPDVPSLPANTGETAPLPEEMSEAEFVQMLRGNPQLVEQLMNGALELKRWDWLEFLLPLYRSMQGHDAAFADLSEGLMWREQGRHKQAIAQLRAIIAAQPDALYVRLHLAAMLFEDKQYEAAADQFRKVGADDTLPENARDMVAQYLEAIQKQEKWRYGVGVNYERTDNVNNASEDRYITINGKCLGFGPGMCLSKNEDSLPKSASGIRYHADVGRDWNISGNHYLSAEAALDGVNYRDAHDYNELGVRVAAGYAWRDVKRQFDVMPYVEYMRLGGEKYSRGAGVAASYGYWLSPKWQLIAAGDVGRTVYEQQESYDHNRVSLSATAAYLPTAKTMLFGGIDGAYSKARAEVQSYRGYGVRVGAAQEFPWGISARVQVRYGEKSYREAIPMYGYNRRDKEYFGTVSLWHRAVSAWGITPKLNLQYFKTDSNMASFYSRDAKRVFVSLEKTF